MSEINNIDKIAKTEVVVEPDPVTPEANPYVVIYNNSGYTVYGTVGGSAFSLAAGYSKTYYA